jgi:hypothetical protein
LFVIDFIRKRRPLSYENRALPVFKVFVMPMTAVDAGRARRTSAFTAWKYRLLISSKSSHRQVQAVRHPLSRVERILPPAAHLVTTRNPEAHRSQSGTETNVQEIDVVRRTQKANEGFILTLDPREQPTLID